MIFYILKHNRKVTCQNIVSIITYDDKSFTQLKALKDKYTEDLHHKSSDYINVIIKIINRQKGYIYGDTLYMNPNEGHAQTDICLYNDVSSFNH